LNFLEEHLAWLTERRSVRAFTDNPISEEDLLRLVGLASWAPSAGNRQDWFFTAVADVVTKSRMADAVRNCWQRIVAENQDLGVIEEVKRYSSTFASFEQAPAVIVVSARKPDALQRHLLGDVAEATTGSSVSAAMAAQNLMLAAHAMGLGSCCMTGAVAAREELARLVGLSGKSEIVCLVAVGMPANLPAAPPRKPVSEIARIIR